jgi:lipid kinase, YegS/Rv2252/BmrU family
MKHLFIVNPAAGKGRTLKRIPEITSYFKGSENECIIEVTKYPGHATEIAAEYSSRDNYRIYSVGGDGTLNEVLNGMVGSGSCLATIPSGSGNDFIKSITEDNDFNNIITRTIEGEVHSMDCAKVNDNYFINIASLGFDGQVVYNTQYFKKLPLVSGRMAYIMGILATIILCKKNTLDIKIDDASMKIKTLLIAVGNGRYYGGGMLALPSANISDGLFEICLAERMSRPRILRLFPKYIKGQHASIEGVHFYKGKKVEIKSETPIVMNSDGEISIVTSAVFEIIPNGVNFIFPKE